MNSTNELLCSYLRIKGISPRNFAAKVQIFYKSTLFCLRFFCETALFFSDNWDNMGTTGRTLFFCLRVVFLFRCVKWSKTTARPEALTCMNPTAPRPIGLDGVGSGVHRDWAPKGATDGVVLSRVALYEARRCVWPFPRPHEVFDLCALGLIQVKASGLVQAFGLLCCRAATVLVWPLAWDYFLSLARILRMFFLRCV